MKQIEEYYNHYQIMLIGLQ